MNNLKLPSSHQVDAIVDVNLGEKNCLRDCKVAAVKFTNYGKVLYDIDVLIDFDLDIYSLIENVDSVFVTHPISFKTPCETPGGL